MSKKIRAVLFPGLVVLGLVLLVGLAAQCPSTEPTPITPAPTKVPLPTRAATVAAKPPTATASLPTPTTASPPPVADNTNCITCHTDEETLKAVAKVVEEEPSQSEGEG